MQDYLAALLQVFRLVRELLADDGTLWLNLGDSYSSGRSKGGLPPKNLMGIPWRLALALQDDGWFLRQDIINTTIPATSGWTCGSRRAVSCNWTSSRDCMAAPSGNWWRICWSGNGRRQKWQ